MTSLGTPTDPLASAAQHANLALPAGTRFSSVKRLIVRLGRIVTDRQVAYNLGIVDSIVLLRNRLDQMGSQLSVLQEIVAGDASSDGGTVRSEFARLQLDVTEARTQAALVETQLSGITEMMRRLETRLNQTQDGLTLLRREQEASNQRQRAQQSLVELFLREVRRSLPKPPAPEALAELPSGSDDLYEALEDTFRGSFHDVKERLRAYLPDVEAVAATGQVIDVGTGRGEWLELLREAGIDGYGIDTNASAVERCRRRDLKVVHGDALEHLAGLPDASVAAVTGFHLAEHLEFDTLVDLIDHAARVLVPGGLLLLESPNPTNVAVGAAYFYVDPTHKRPLHPQLLEFLMAARGFDDVEVRYMHPSMPLQLNQETDDAIRGLQPLIDQLNELLFGPQ
ncbi:MAG: methyltransferase domain-containing protein, partial [Actinomycetota bacterium]|nr:methyltransferase domain-containing protein [Actinomycetota bacterium]